MYKIPTMQELDIAITTLSSLISQAQMKSKPFISATIQQFMQVVICIIIIIIIIVIALHLAAEGLLQDVTA